MSWLSEQIAKNSNETVVKRTSWENRRFAKTITSKNNHYHWMYNNESMITRASWFDTYSWEIGNNKQTVNFNNFVSLIDDALREIAQIGRIGLIYPSRPSQKFIVERLNILQLPYQMYYIPIQHIPQIPFHNKIITETEIQADVFESYVEEWAKVTKSWRIYDAYFSYVADKHKSVMLHCNPPMLKNIKMQKGIKYGPSYWCMSRSELDWGLYRWAAHTNNHVINPYKWTAELIATWLSCDFIKTAVAKDDFMDHTDYLTLDIFNSLGYDISVRLRDPWIEIPLQGFVGHLNTLSKTIIKKATNSRHLDVAYWPLHRLAEHLNLPCYDYVAKEYIKIYGAV